MKDPQRSSVLAEVAEERFFQDQKWGLQNHHPAGWYAVLGEEYGEVGEALCEQAFLSPQDWSEYRKELIQVAAVAVAAVEALDRGEFVSNRIWSGRCA